MVSYIYNYLTTLKYKAEKKSWSPVFDLFISDQVIQNFVPNLVASDLGNFDVPPVGRSLNNDAEPEVLSFGCSSHGRVPALEPAKASSGAV
jgi:hypothetical protein